MRQLQMEPSLELSRNGSSAENYGSREKNDTYHQTNSPGNRHLSAHKIAYNARHYPHEQSGEKVRHRIAVPVYQCKHEIRRDRFRWRLISAKEEAFPAMKFTVFKVLTNGVFIDADIPPLQISGSFFSMPLS